MQGFLPRVLLLINAQKNVSEKAGEKALLAGSVRRFECKYPTGNRGGRYQYAQIHDISRHFPILWIQKAFIDIRNVKAETHRI